MFLSRASDSLETLFSDTNPAKNIELSRAIQKSNRNTDYDKAVAGKLGFIGWDGKTDYVQSSANRHNKNDWEGVDQDQTAVFVMSIFSLNMDAASLNTDPRDKCACYLYKSK